MVYYGTAQPAMMTPSPAVESPKQLTMSQQQQWAGQPPQQSNKQAKTTGGNIAPPSNSQHTARSNSNPANSNSKEDAINPKNHNGAYSNTIKTFDNLLYCFSCKYNVDHEEWQCT